MTAIEFYRLTEEMLDNLANTYYVEDLSKYYNLTDEKTLGEIESKIKFNDLGEIEKVFVQIAFHGQNAQRIDKIVDFKNKFDFLYEVTQGFKPTEFLNKYKTDDLEESKELIVKELRKGLKWNSEKSTKNPDATAKRFAGILIRTAEYLRDFKTKEQVVNDLMSNYKNNDFEKLIKYFRRKIDIGFSVALSCDFLKEFEEKFTLPKPDTHMRDAMAKYKKLSDGYKNNDKGNYQCIQDTLDVVNEINVELRKAGEKEVSVYQFDRMVYLVCSQNFFLDDKTKGVKSVYLGKM